MGSYQVSRGFEPSWGVGGGIVGGVAASPIPVPGARVGGALAASGVAAYRMDKAMFSQQLIDAYRQSTDHETTTAEIDQLMKRTRGLRAKHAL